jgi:hypothetical protein
MTAPRFFFAAPVTSDVGRQAAVMSTGREQPLFKEAEEMVPPDAGIVSQALVQGVGFVARSISGR